MRHLNNIILAAVVLAAVLANLVDKSDPRLTDKPKRPPLPRGELEMVARTLLGECGKCGDTEIRWIAHVIYNRLDSGRYGSDLVDVVTFQRRGVYHFSTWDKRLNKAAIVAPGVESTAAFRRVARLAELAWKEEQDPTGGAVHFFHPASMKPLGRVPNWARDRVGKAVAGAIFFGP